MEKKRESYYPVGPDDTMRICSWSEEKWNWPYFGAKKKTVTRRECNQRFEVWNRQANHDPWSLCWKHAFDDPEDRKKRRRFK